jgi:hypothetical protein
MARQRSLSQKRAYQMDVSELLNDDSPHCDVNSETQLGSSRSMQDNPQHRANQKCRSNRLPEERGVRPGTFLFDELRNIYLRDRRPLRGYELRISALRFEIILDRDLSGKSR